MLEKCNQPHCANAKQWHFLSLCKPQYLTRVFTDLLRPQCSQHVRGVTLWSLFSLKPHCALWQRVRPGSPATTRWKRRRRWCRSAGTRSSRTAARTRSSPPTSPTATQVGWSDGATAIKLLWEEQHAGYISDMASATVKLHGWWKANTSSWASSNIRS